METINTIDEQGRFVRFKFYHNSKVGQKIVILILI